MKCIKLMTTIKNLIFQTKKKTKKKDYVAAHSLWILVFPMSHLFFDNKGLNI